MNRLPVFFFALALTLGGCSLTVPDISLDQAFYFTIRRVEDTRGQTYLIDQQGKILALDTEAPFASWELVEDTLFWAEEDVALSLNLDHPEVAQVEEDQLKRWVDGIPPNEGITVNAAALPCCGLPITDYVAWVYEPEEGRYRSVFLGTLVGEETEYRLHRTRQGRRLARELQKINFVN